MICEACGDPLDELDPSFGWMHRACVERVLARLCGNPASVDTSGTPVRFLSWQ